MISQVLVVIAPLFVAGIAAFALHRVLNLETLVRRSNAVHEDNDKWTLNEMHKQTATIAMTQESMLRLTQVCNSALQVTVAAQRFCADLELDDETATRGLKNLEMAIEDFQRATRVQ